MIDIDLNPGCPLLVVPVTHLPDPLAQEMAGSIVYFVQMNHAGHAVVELRSTNGDKAKRYVFRPIDLKVIE